MNRLLVLLITLACALSAAAQKKPDAVDEMAALLKPDRVEVYKEAGGRRLEMHIFEPEKKSVPVPCYLVIHGGGWAGGEPKRMYPFAAHYARQGMVGVSLQYRLYNTKTGVSVFDCVKDARSAMRWLAAHSDGLGIDPKKIIVSGGSAGGHLAASTALFDQVNDETGDAALTVTPAALILLFPVIDTSAEGYGNARIGERWRELSPAHNVRPGLPPTLTFHGTGDTVTPYAGARAFHEAMLEKGNRSMLITHEGGRHGYLMSDSKLFADTMAKSDAFLRELGLLPVPAK
ncbi:MAG TPA: alpha/beta hydrolase [Prosthecobacter sp.]|nr:alpha/beta hydrolase [Prosthecobacter sp.]HRK17224.1 alpha/beta hydrolase [Prosthecobacter sp.]